MKHKLFFRTVTRLGLLSFFTALILSGCSGGGSSATASAGGGGSSANVTIGGTVSGLASGQQVVLAINGGNVLTVTSNASFTFTAPIANSTNYAVTVSSEPTGQICTVSNGSGSAKANVSNVSVTCVTAALLVQNNQLLDSTGKVVVFRGVNVPVYQTGNVNDLAAVAAAVKRSGANAVRLEWWSNVNDGWPSSGYQPPLYTLANLDAAIQTYADLGILPIIELHDVTCWLAIGLNPGTGQVCNDTTMFANRITNFWTTPGVVAIIKKHQNHLIVDLANEWGSVYSASDEATFVSNYVTAISTIRTAWSNGGVGNLPLMVDAPNGGTDVAAFTGPSTTAGKSNGQLILEADPLGNTMFSVHAYWAAVDGITHTVIDSYMSSIASSNLSIVVGETGAFADGNCANTVDFQYVLNAAYTQKLGTIAWAWYQDGTCAVASDPTNLTGNNADGVTLPAYVPGSLTFQNLVLYGSGYGLATAVPVNFGP